MRALIKNEERAWTIAAVIIAVVCLVLMQAFWPESSQEGYPDRFPWSKAQMLEQFDTTQVKVPPIEGLSVREALVVLEEAGLLPAYGEMDSFMPHKLDWIVSDQWRPPGRMLPRDSGVGFDLREPNAQTAEL